MRITKWGEYGILCSLFLAQRGDGSACTASEIAEARNIPLPYTHQILHRLKTGAVITTQRGRNGGYRLARPPHEITLRSILEAAEGDFIKTLCEIHPVYEEACTTQADLCGLRHVWQEIEAAIAAVLEKRTLQWLVENHGLDPLKPEPLIRIGSGSMNEHTTNSSQISDPKEAPLKRFDGC